MTRPGGVKVQPDPPQAGGEVTITVANGADRIFWRVSPGGELHEVPAKDGKATIRVPAGAGGRDLSISAGTSVENAVGERFPIIDTG